MNIVFSRPDHPSTSSASTRRSVPGFTLTELGVVMAVMLGLIAIGIPIYLRSVSEGHDTKARATLQQVVDVAQSRITTDAYNSYRDYGTSEVLIQELERVAPELVRDAAGEDTPATLKRLSGGDGSPGDRSSYVNPPEGLPGNPDAADPLGTIGIGVTEKGELVAAMFSASGECWMVRHDPSRSGSGVSYAKGDPQNCGWATDWLDVEEDENFPPVAQSQTVTVAPGESVDITLVATDPDGDDLAFSANGGADPSFQGTLSDIDPVTNTVTYTAEAGDFGATYYFDFTATETDPDKGLSDTGRVTINVDLPDPGDPSGGTFQVDLTCPDTVNYGSSALCTTSVVNNPAGGVIVYQWEILGANPVDCDDHDECTVQRDSVGAVEVRLTATNSFGHVSTPDDVVEFVAVDPVIEVICATPVSYTASSLCQASVSDENRVDTYGSGDFTWSAETETGIPLDFNTCTSAGCLIVLDDQVPTDVDVEVTVYDKADTTRANPISTTATVVFHNEGPSAPDLVCPPPHYHIADPDAASVDPVNCTASGSVDPEGEPVTYHWDFTPAHTYTPAACASNANCEVTSATPGEATIAVWAEDSFGAQSERTELTIEFVNIAPEVSRIVCHSADDPDQEATYFNLDARCSTTGVSDANGDPIEFSWETTPAADSEDVTVRANCADPNSDECSLTRHNPGSVTVTLTADDGNLFGETSRSGTAIFVNALPVGTVTCTSSRTEGNHPTTNRVGSPPVNCTAAFVDPNGEPLTYEWAASDDVLGEGINACTSNACVIKDEVSAGTNYRPNINALPNPNVNTAYGMPRVKVSDNYGHVEAELPNPIKIVNDPPAVVRVLNSGAISCLSDNPPASAAARNCTVTVEVSDPDAPAVGGNSATVNWPNLGTGVTTTSCDSTVNLQRVSIGGGRYDYRDTASCTYRADMRQASWRNKATRPLSITVSVTSDGQTSSGTGNATATATVRNQEPYLVSNPSPANIFSCTTENGALCLLRVTFADPEGGTLSYTWPQLKGSGAPNAVPQSCTGAACNYKFSQKGRTTNTPKMTGTVTVTDLAGKKGSRAVQGTWTPISSGPMAAYVECRDPDAPAPNNAWKAAPGSITATHASTVIECRAGVDGSGAGCTASLPCANEVAADHGFSHRYWFVNGTATASCNAGQGGMHRVCRLNYPDQQKKVHTVLRSNFCNIPSEKGLHRGQTGGDRCASGDGSISSANLSFPANTMTIKWPEPSSNPESPPPPPDGGHRSDPPAGGGNGSGNSCQPDLLIDTRVTKLASTVAVGAHYGVDKADCTSRMTYSLKPTVTASFDGGHCSTFSAGCLHNFFGSSASRDITVSIKKKCSSQSASATVTLTSGDAEKSTKPSFSVPAKSCGGGGGGGGGTPPGVFPPI